MKALKRTALPINQIVQGHAVDVLRRLPEECIDTVVTSPPYWGLRAYGTMPQTWSGDPECAHEWQLDNCFWHSDRGDNPHKEVFDRSFPSKGTQYGTCRKCNAWRGELGLEPYFFQYVEHVCRVFDEIKRVLKPSGTVWVNL